MLHKKGKENIHTHLHYNVPRGRTCSKIHCPQGSSISRSWKCGYVAGTILLQMSYHFNPYFLAFLDPICQIHDFPTLSLNIQHPRAPVNDKMTYTQSLENLHLSLLDKSENSLLQYSEGLSIELIHFPEGIMPLPLYLLQTNSNYHAETRKQKLCPWRLNRKKSSFLLLINWTSPQQGEIFLQILILSHYRTEVTLLVNLIKCLSRMERAVISSTLSVSHTKFSHWLCKIYIFPVDFNNYKMIWRSIYRHNVTLLKINYSKYNDTYTI
jgi:hypothetical protein